MLWPLGFGGTAGLLQTDFVRHCCHLVVVLTLTHGLSSGWNGGRLWLLQVFVVHGLADVLEGIRARQDLAFLSRRGTFQKTPGTPRWRKSC